MVAAGGGHRARAERDRPIASTPAADRGDPRPALPTDHRPQLAHRSPSSQLTDTSRLGSCSWTSCMLAGALPDAAGLVRDRLRSRAPEWPADDLAAELTSLAGTLGPHAP